MSNLIPVSRKEQYLSKIDGMTNKSPDKTYTKEEYFFSEILGEALHKPVLETRYEMYLAKIAGREIGIPYPETRLERFLAKAAGMNISVPTPITREEMYWSTYSPFYLSNSSGTSPLTYGKCKIGTLSNYRIYGNTVSGESVGDRTANLFDIKTFAETCFKYSATVNYTNNTLTFTATGMDAYVNAALYTGVVVPLYYRSSCIDVLPSTTYTISMSSAPKCFISWVDSSFNVVSNYTAIPTNATSYTFTTPENCTKLLIRLGKEVTNIGDTFTISDIMLNSGSIPLPYEPYGYKVPVTVEGKNLVTSYLVEPNGGIQYFPVVYVEVNLQPNTEYLITFTVHENGVKLYSNDLLFTPIYYSSETQGKKTMRLKTKTSIQRDQHINNKGWVLLRNAKQNPSDFTITDVKIQLVSDAPITTPIYLPEPIKMVGDEAEYVDYAEQKQHRVRKNLLNISANTTVVNGISFTVNSDKSITITGNLTQSKADFDLIAINSLILNSGEYLVSCENASASANTYFIIGGSSSTGHVPYKIIDNSNSVKVSCSGGNIGYCRIRVLSNIENPITLYPMIRLASIEDDTYEPYIENTDLDVTLPALPTLPGTNTLSVGTEVQPSEVEVTGRIRPVPTGGGE